MKLKKKKPWFDEDSCMVVERRKQAKLKFLQDQVEVNRDNYFNERREASGTLRNKKRGYLKEKLNGVETNSNNKNIRDLYKGIKDFKNGYQARVNVINDENGNDAADGEAKQSTKDSTNPDYTFLPHRDSISLIYTISCVLCPSGRNYAMSILLPDFFGAQLCHVHSATRLLRGATMPCPFCYLISSGRNYAMSILLPDFFGAQLCHVHSAT
ncbi:hypothetical protein ANN_05762 [Periplaneta americana]|uniref:Uncharacterized protein n=1 Tax=Periplaneta americana TaxID=6978 RepID=A0ABQ8TDG6_PERAM|nr:hypothetical protein ANN_05762 [Periplaneta americana]